MIGHELKVSDGDVISMSTEEALKALDSLESFAIEVITKDVIDFELLERIRVPLIEVRSAVHTIELAVAELINRLVVEHGEPDEDRELSIPKDSFGAAIMIAKMQELMGERTVELAMPLELGELRDAVGIPEGSWRLRAR